MQQPDTQEQEATSPPPMPKETPLPWGQLLPLLALRLSEPINYTLILPFVYKMIDRFGVASSPKDIAFYASLLFSSFSVSQAMTIMYWSRLSDRIGRRPVLLMGLLGNLTTFLLFSISTSFSMALGARSLNGLLSGNVAVMKSVLAEISDDSNRARMMALLPLTWNVGSVAGAAIGGLLADPAVQFPGLFGSFKPFIAFPYLLPCLVGSSVTAAGLLVGVFVVKETLPKSHLLNQARSLAADTTPLINPLPLEQQAAQSSRTYRQLMTPTVQTVMVTNAITCLAISMSDQIYPIFAATSAADGGLGFGTRSIGYSLAVAGLAVFYMQLVTYPKLERKYGALFCYRQGQKILIPFLLATPFLSRLAARCAHRQPSSLSAVWPLEFYVLWTLLVVLLLLRVMGQVLIFTSINLLTANLAPTRADLGFMNGVQQLAMSTTRVVGPLLAGTMWSWSIKYELPYLLNAHAVWVFCVALTCTSLFLTRRIPESVNKFAADLKS
ncbi:hypothetical protein EV174_003434 [Coemansia sp. RSA 2320]|nr:hypothetical protein EV174_003434 [Coemansia sp. RSA 2320]